MQDFKLGAVESRFADLIWLHAPITTSELVKLCAQELSWKRTTTYTVLKRLCERGLCSHTAALAHGILRPAERTVRRAELRRFASRISRRIHHPQTPVPGGNLRDSPHDRCL